MTAHLFIDGAPATPADLAHQALVNYGAYTSFRVENGGARGLDRHLARLQASASDLFGEAPSEARLRELIHGALGARTQAWMRVNLFSGQISPRTPSAVGAPRVMVAVLPPPPPLAASLTLKTLTYEREAPHLKHVATFGLIRARRQAREAGFDDALFLTRDGRVSEGPLWNVGFLQGETVVWPSAPMLDGVTQAVLKDGLEAAGLAQVTRAVEAAELADFDAAFICNSATPAAPVTAIDGRGYPPRVDLIDRLESIWNAAPLQPIPASP